MHVLIAPDSFAGTLSAPEAARAIAQGWQAYAPADTVDLAPLADGGEGFVEVLHEALGGELAALTVHGPDGAAVPATLLQVDDVAYVESAQACGMPLGDPDRATDASSFGVGELVRAAVAAGARRIVVGVGSSAVTDGGAGALAALGAVADRPLDAGARSLRGIGRVDLDAARRLVAGRQLVCAHDTSGPLTGLFGTAKSAGPERGLAEADILAVDAALEEWARATHRRASLDPAAGAGGGLGFALGLLDADATSGIGLVMEQTNLRARARDADVVLTGEGRFDHTSRAGKVPHGVALVAGEALRPCVVLAGEVLVGTREMRALGIEAAYALSDEVGVERARGEAYPSLVATAARVARTWSR